MRERQELVSKSEIRIRRKIYIFHFYKKRYIDQGTAQMNKEFRFSRGRRCGWEISLGST